MNVTLCFESLVGKRSYRLYLSVDICEDGYNDFSIINGNVVDFYCNNPYIDPQRSHKDWGKAFNLHPSKYGILVEFTKPFNSIRGWQNLKCAKIGFESSVV